MRNADKILAEFTFILTRTASGKIRVRILNSGKSNRELLKCLAKILSVYYSSKKI